MAAKIKVDQIETVDATDSITINNTVVMASGKTLPAASLTGTLPVISGANLTNLTAANIAGTLPAISGANLTNLPADATKLPLAGGTMTGNLVVTRGSGNAVTRFQGASNSQSSKLFVSHVSSGDGGLYYNSNYMDIFSYSDMRFNVGTANVSGTIGNQRMVIKNNGNVGIGTTSPASARGIGGAVLHISDTPDAALRITDTGGSDFEISAETITTMGTVDATDLAIITNNTQRLRVLAGGGLCFGTDTAAANALDDYEEGTWTPTLIGSGGGTGTWASSVNTYTKVGRAVHITAYLNCTSLGNMSNAVIIGGLPFTNASAGGYQALATGSATGLAIGAGNCVTAFINVNATTIHPRLWNATTGTAAYGFYIGELTADGSLMLSGTYFAT